MSIEFYFIFLQVGSFMYNTAMGICVQVFGYVLILFLGRYLGMKLLNYSKLILNFYRHFQSVFRKGSAISTPAGNARGFGFLFILARLST